MNKIWKILTINVYLPEKIYHGLPWYCYLIAGVLAVTDATVVKWSVVIYLILYASFILYRRIQYASVS